GGAHSGIQLFYPTRTRIAPQTDAYHGPKRHSAHRRDVAEIASHRLPADLTGGITSLIVDAFHHRVAGVKQILVGMAAAQYRAVVADADNHGTSRRTNDASQFVNQAKFTETMNTNILFQHGLHECERMYRSIPTLVALNSACMVIGASREPVNS